MDNNLENILNKKKKRKAVAGGWPKLFNIPREWLHQGFTYLDKTQRYYRMLYETLFFLFFTWSCNILFKLSFTNYLLWVVTAFITHTIFWIFDSNWWAGFMFTYPWTKNPGEQKTIDYLNKMAIRMKNTESISSVLIYGSISRGVWHNKSDLDVRFLRRSGFGNGFLSIFVLYRERFIALIKKQPLDVYVADSINFLKKMREDEIPVMLKKDNQILDQLYPDITVEIIKKLKKP